MLFGAISDGLIEAARGEGCADFAGKVSTQQERLVYDALPFFETAPKRLLRCGWLTKQSKKHLSLRRSRQIHTQRMALYELNLRVREQTMLQQIV